jgi:hypothetical protein
MNDLTWTEARVARLHQLHASGCTKVEIARQLGLTKNAVTGRLAREYQAGTLYPREPRPPFVGTLQAPW